MLLMNGTIYLKKEIIKKSHFVVRQEDALRLPNNLETEVLKAFFPELFKNEKEIDENFWLIFATEANIKMYNCNSKEVETYPNAEDVDSNFISLEEFIEKSTYVGRTLLIPAGTEVIKNGKNIFYTEDKAQYIILYCLEERLIVRDLNSGKYEIVASTNPEFKKYTVKKEVNPEYADKKEVYQDIVSQIYHNEKEYNQGLER